MSEHPDIPDIEAILRKRAHEGLTKQLDLVFGLVIEAAAGVLDKECALRVPTDFRVVTIDEVLSWVRDAIFRQRRDTYTAEVRNHFIEAVARIDGSLDLLLPQKEP